MLIIFFDPKLVDLFIVDIKIMDPVEHKKYVGTDNDLILSNFKTLASTNQNILVRIPLIPEITSKEENIRAISRFVRENAPDTTIELINFNPLAEHKYRLMGKDHIHLSEMKPYTQKELGKFYSIIKEEGAQINRESVNS